MGPIWPKMGRITHMTYILPIKALARKLENEITYTKHLQMPILLFCVLGPNWAKLGPMYEKIQDQS